MLETVAVAESAAGVACTLYAIEGARSTVTQLEALWTMPGHLAQGGPLTSSAPHLVDNARTSVTCSTYNFQKSSAMWDALARAAARPEMALRVYVDTHAADREPNGWTPTTTELAAHLYPAVVLRTKSFGGGYVRNHAKFLAVDHRFLLVTSANFSWSAEQGNVEFGVLIDNPNLSKPSSANCAMRRTLCTSGSFHEASRRIGGLKDTLATALYRLLEPERVDAVFRALGAHRDEIEQRYGGPLSWEELPDAPCKPDCRLCHGRRDRD